MLCLILHAQYSVRWWKARDPYCVLIRVCVFLSAKVVGCSTQQNIPSSVHPSDHLDVHPRATKNGFQSGYIQSVCLNPFIIV